MTELFQCDDKEQLVAYLYDELDEVTRRRIDEHLRVCATCAAEVGGLSGVRHELAGWAPPEAELGFSIVPRVRDEARPPRRCCARRTAGACPTCRRGRRPRRRCW